MTDRPHICQAQLFSRDGCLPMLSTLYAYRHLVPHCRGNVRTPARYFQSANASLTAGTGTVRELAVIARVGAQTLLLRHFAPPSLVVCARAPQSVGPPDPASVNAEKGQLQDLQWNDVTCGACGGRGSNRCITAVSSDATQYSCSGEF